MVHENYWVAIFILLSGLNIVLNFITVVIIGSSHQLREITEHILKVSIACADLMMSFLHLMFYSKLLASNGEKGCFQATPIETMAELVGYFVVGWTLVTLNIMNIYEQRATACGLSSLLKPGPRCKYLCVLHWFVGTCIVVPVVMTSAKDYELPHLDEVMCIAYLPESILITFSLIALHLPCYLNVAYLITVLVCNCHSRHVTRPPANEQGGAIDEAIYDQNNVLLSTLPVMAYVTSLLPLVLYTWAWFLYGWPSFEPISATVTVCLLCRSFVQPFSWLGSSVVRTAVKSVCRCIKTQVARLCRQTGTFTQVHVTYDVLHEPQTLREI